MDVSLGHSCWVSTPAAALFGYVYTRVLKGGFTIRPLFQTTGGYSEPVPPEGLLPKAEAGGTELEVAPLMTP